jgi:hypothetical protein
MTLKSKGRKRSDLKSKAASFSMFTTIGNVPVDDWMLATNSKVLFTSIDYLAALEKSKPSGLLCRYVIVYEQEVPVATLLFQLLNVGDKDLGGVLNLQDKGWLLQNLNGTINRMLFSCKHDLPNYLVCCGNLLISGEYGITVSAKPKLPIVMQKFSQIIEAVKKSVEPCSFCAWMVKDFFDTTLIDQALEDEGYVLLPMDPEMIFYVRDNWLKFSDYVDAMSAKYRLKCNQALKKMEEVSISNLTIAQLEKFSSEMMKLYHNVQQRSTVQLLRVNKNYFIELKKTMPDSFYVKGFFLGSKLIAFTSGFVFDEHHEAHFIGIDYTYNKSHQLYQNILYSFIKEAILKKSKYIYFGRTAMEMKTTVGARAYPLATYFKLENGFLNKMFKPVIRRATVQPWIPRNPFKEV